MGERVEEPLVTFPKGPILESFYTVKGVMGMWVFGSMCLCVCGSMCLWVCGSVGLWVYGSVFHAFLPDVPNETGVADEGVGLQACLKFQPCQECLQCQQGEALGTV